MFRIILIVYLCLLIRFIVLKYPLDVLKQIADEWGLLTIKEGITIGIENANFKPFRSILMYINYFNRINGLGNLIGNICAFIPLGALFCVALPKQIKYGVPVLYCGLFSLLMELFQLVTHFGIFDVDDIILNTFGGFIGYGIFLLMKKGHKARKKA